MKPLIQPDVPTSLPGLGPTHRTEDRMVYHHNLQELELPEPGQPFSGNFQAPAGMRLTQVVPLGRRQPKVVTAGGKVICLVLMIYEGVIQVSVPIKKEPAPGEPSV